MATLVALIAILIALGALWFTSEVIKRFDGHSRLLLKPEMGVVNAELAEARANAITLDRRVADLERQLRMVRRVSGDQSPVDEAPAPMMPTGVLSPSVVFEARHFTPSQFHTA